MALRGFIADGHSDFIKTSVMAERTYIIDFEEELKKFHPSLELSDLEDSLHQQDTTDAVDVLVSVMQTESARQI